MRDSSFLRRAVACSSRHLSHETGRNGRDVPYGSGQCGGPGVQPRPDIAIYMTIFSMVSAMIVNRASISKEDDVRRAVVQSLELGRFV